MKIEVSYTLSKLARVRRFIETGEIPPEKVRIDVDVNSISPEAREILAQYLLGMGNHSIDIVSYRVTSWGSIAQTDFPLDEDPDTECVIEHVRRMVQEYQIAEADSKAFQERLAAERAASEAQRAAAAAEREKAAAAAEHEKAAWIDAYGSTHLRRAYAAGHDCLRAYLIERAAVEYPGFVVDFDDKARWSSRSCPSVRALDERDAILLAYPGVEATIVWLKSPPKDYAGNEEEYATEEHFFEPCEAIIVRDPRYRGKDLVRALGG